MAKWAIGARLRASTDKIVEDAIDKGEIIRTHALRPTWHFIAAEDVNWLLDLTGVFMFHKAEVSSQVPPIGLQCVPGESLLNGKVIEKAIKQIFFHTFFYGKSGH